MDIKKSITTMIEQIEEFKQQIINNVEDIPENPKIKRISKSPNCFILNSKDLGNNWSPEYHDSKYQAQTIIKLIKDRDSLNNIQKMLEEIVNKGIYQVEPGHKMHFNDQVREYIKNLL